MEHRCYSRGYNLQIHFLSQGSQLVPLQPGHPCRICRSNAIDLDVRCRRGCANLTHIEKKPLRVISGIKMRYLYIYITLGIGMIIEFIAVKGHNCVHGVSKSCRTDILRHTLITSFLLPFKLLQNTKIMLNINILDYLNVDKTSWIILMLVKEWLKKVSLFNE